MTRLALFLSLLAGGAEAQPNTAILTPPKAYQGDVTVTVAFMDADRIPALCVALGAKLAKGSYALACTVGRTIYLPNPCQWPNHSDYQQLACHEKSHASGWPADHPKE